MFAPTLNEALNLRELYQRIRSVDPDSLILLIDDGSCDNTESIIQDIAKSDSNIQLLQRGSKRGIGSAHREALRIAFENSAEWLITMDADLTHRPEDFPLFFSTASDAAVVIGSRHQQKDSMADWPFFRRALSLGYHRLSRWLLGLPYDSSNAFRLYRLALLDRRWLDHARENGHGFFLESIFLMARADTKIIQVPVTLPARKYGQSKMGIREFLLDMRLLIRLFLNQFFIRAVNNKKSDQCHS